MTRITPCQLAHTQTHDNAFKKRVKEEEEVLLLLLLLLFVLQSDGKKEERNWEMCARVNDVHS